MARKLAPAVALISMVISATALALGLGDIQTRSALNQNFEAEVSLLSVDPSELDTLKVRLASPEAFQRAGVDRPFYLSSLRFAPMLNKAGKPVIRVYSTNPIREPFLNFLVEVNWPKGRLLREYTVLLDPPTTLKRRPAAVTRGTSGATTATAPASRTSAPTRTVLPNEYQVSDSDTLWGIAKELRPSGVSLTQTLMALYKANPEAFINGDINRLKKGRILRVPSRDDMLALSRGAANAAYRAAQDTALASRAQPAAEPAPEATSESATGGEGSGSGVAAGASDNAELRIAAPSPEGEGQAGAGDKVAEGEGAEDLENALLLARENAETSRQVAENLRGEVSTLEQQLADMQRLLSLKDEQLARLQAGLGEGETAATETPAAESSVTEPASTDSPAVAEGAGAPSVVDSDTAAADAGMAPESPAMTDMPAAADADAETSADATNAEVAADEAAAVAAEEAPTDGASGEAGSVPSDTDMSTGDMSAAVAEGETPPTSDATEAMAGAPSEADAGMSAAEGDEPEIAAPAMAEAEPVPAPMDEAMPGETEAPKGWLDRLMGNTALLAGAGAAVIALLVGLVALMRRGKKDEVSSAEQDRVSADSSTEPVAAQPEHLDAEDESILLEPGEGGDQPTADDVGGHDDETSFLSEFSPSEMNSLADETSEVDPVSEADVYIAYGRYDQAEELLSQALQRDPDRLALKFKLLEVYYANRNIAGFTARAQELADAGQDAVDAAGWQRVCDMGRDLAPDYPLFAGAGAGAASVDAASDFAPSEPAGFDPLSGFNEGSELHIPAGENASGVQDTAGDAGGETEMDLTLDLEDLSMPHSVSTDDESIDGLESIDLELPDLDLDPARPQTDKPTGDDSLMLDLDTSLEDSVADSRPASATDEDLDAESLQAQLDELSDLTDLDDELSQLTADFDGLDMPTTEDQPGPDLDIPSPFDDQLAEDDEVQTKLDLALAYVEMGDKEGARSILDEVKAEGNDVQKAQADKLLADLS